MSAIRTNANAKSTTAFGKKPFCKVCFDAKKPESEYSSHFVRSLPDMNGKTVVTCPVLKATECRYCYNFGHTAKFCPVLEDNKKKAAKAKSVAIRAQKAEKAAAAPMQYESKTDMKYAGKFAGLEEDDEPEVIVNLAVEIPADFPTLQKKEVRFAATSSNNWASIAAKPAVPVFKPTPKVVEAPAKSWADESDSEEEEEESFPAMPMKTHSMFQKEESDDEWDNLPVITRTTSIVSGRQIAEDDDW